MFAVDRIWMDETMHKVASAESTVLDGMCIRTARIEHCNEIKPGSANWVITRSDGTPVEREPWSCVPGTPLISHHELETPEGTLVSAGVPLAVAVVSEFQAQLDEYIREYEALLRRRVAGLEELEGAEHPADPGHDQAAGERTVTTPRYVTRSNGQQVQVDDQGWGLTKNGQRDLRYKEPIGPPLP